MSSSIKNFHAFLLENWAILTAIVATAFAGGAVYHQIHSIQTRLEQRDVIFESTITGIRKDIGDMRESVSTIKTHLAEDRTMLQMILRDSRNTSYVEPPTIYYAR